MMLIELAPSGRSSCRGCKKKISKGDYRYVEERQGEGDWEYRSLWHLGCAVERRYVGASQALAGSSELPEDLRVRLLSQTLLHRCGQHEEVVESTLWVAPEKEGWAHLVCQLESGRFAVVTDLDGEWRACIEGTKEDALAVLPDLIFEFAVQAIAGETPDRKGLARSLKKLLRMRKSKARAKGKILGGARRAATLAAKKRGVPVAELTKGTRVRIVGEVQSTQGKPGQGKLATIFWSGFTKQGVEKRVGMKCDDGAKYWANAADVEPVIPRIRRTGGKKTIAKA